MGNKNTLVENEDEVQEKIIAELEARQNQAKKLLHLRDTLNNASGTIVVGTGRNVITGQLTESVVSLMVMGIFKNVSDTTDFCFSASGNTCRSS